MLKKGQRLWVYKVNAGQSGFGDTRGDWEEYFNDPGGNGGQWGGTWMSSLKFPSPFPG